MSQKKAYLLMIVSIPIIWYAAIPILRLPPFVLPPPNLVLQVLWNERADLLRHTLVTLYVALVGYGLANLIAISLAISFLYLRWFEDFAMPWMVVIKNIPFVVLASILVLTIGSETPVPRIIIVILICFFPILANVSKGLKEADEMLLDRMRSLNASEWQIFRKIRWRSALPYYMAAHENAFSYSIIGAIVGEWFFPKEGLGFLIVRSMSQFRADRIYAITLIASLLAVVALLIVQLAENRLFKWKRQT